MLKFNKNTIKEIVIIVVVSSLLAVVYNYIRTERLPFFPKSQAERMVSNTDLFGPSADSNAQLKEEAGTVATLEEDSTLTKDTASSQLAVDSNKIERMDSVILRADSAVKVDFDAILATAKRSSFGDFKVVDYQQMRRIAADKSGQFLIIDARRAEPYSKRHIGNAINICPYDSADAVMNKVAALPSGKTIIVYCDGGNCDSSHEIANILQAMGFDKFYIYEGGWEEWEKK